MGIISWFTYCCTILVNDDKIKKTNFLFNYFLHLSRAQINILIGFVVLAWIITPAAYYTNLWDAKVMPIVSNRVFSADGYIYNISAVLNPNLRLNETAYKHYGRFRLVRRINFFLFFLFCCFR